MRALRRLTPVALLVAATFLLSGCVEPEPDVVPPPEETTAPVFASDEEALAAATDAYKAYLAMSDLIAQEGGVNPERIAPLAHPDAVADQIGQFIPYREQALHSAGMSAFDSITLQQLAASADGVVELVVYLCLDVSNVRVINAEGTDVTPTGRSDRLPLEIEFVGQGGGGQLLMVRSESWRGANFC